MSAPAIEEFPDFRYPQDGRLIGPAWEYAWNHVYTPGAEPVNRREAAQAVAAAVGLTEKAVTEVLRRATRAGLLSETNPRRRRTTVPVLVRADSAEGVPEYAVREVVHRPAE